MILYPPKKIDVKAAGFHQDMPPEIEKMLGRINASLEKVHDEYVVLYKKYW